MGARDGGRRAGEREEAETNNRWAWKIEDQVSLGQAQREPEHWAEGSEERRADFRRDAVIKRWLARFEALDDSEEAIASHVRARARMCQLTPELRHTFDISS